MVRLFFFGVVVVDVLDIPSSSFFSPFLVFVLVILFPYFLVLL